MKTDLETCENLSVNMCYCYTAMQNTCKRLVQIASRQVISERATLSG